MLTPFAFQTNICAKADYRPFVRSAWMWFPQAQMVIQLQVRKHVQDYTAMILKTSEFFKNSEVWLVCDIFPSKRAKTFLEEKPATAIIGL